VILLCFLGAKRCALTPCAPIRPRPPASHDQVIRSAARRLQDNKALLRGLGWTPLSSTATTLCPFKKKVLDLGVAKT